MGLRFRRLVLLLCLAGCGGGSNGATDAPANVDGASAMDTGGAGAGDGARQDGVADAVVDTAADAVADADSGGSQNDAADAAPDATSVDAPADGGGTGADAAPDAGAPDGGSVDMRPSDAADAPTDQASPADGSNDAGSNVDAGADGPTFSSTPGAGVVRSYETALWARSGHPSTVYSLDWSRDGARVVSVGATDQTIRIFDARSGNLRRLMKIPQGFLHVVAWSANGAWIITGDGEATARLWDGVTGAGIRTFTGHRNAVRAATFSPDGATVTTGGQDATIVMWARDTGAVRRVLAHTGTIYSLAYSPDGQLLASATTSSLRLWNAATGEMVREMFSPMPMPGADGMTGLAFSPDGTLLLTGSYQQVGRVFRVATGEVVTTLNGHTDWVYNVGWNAAGTRALTASWDGTIRIWDTPAFVERRVISTMPAGLRLLTAVWNPGADELAAPDASGGTIRVWDGATGTALRELTGTAGPVYGVAYSPDGTRVASGGSDGKLRLWNAADGTQTAVVDAGGYVRAVAWSPTGDRIAVAGDNGSGGMWNAATGQRAATGTDHGARTNAIAWSPNGNLLATGGANQLVALRDVGAATTQTLSGHTGEINGVAFSPDGKWLASVSTYREVKIWDTTTGALVRSLMGGITGSADAVAFSPDGTLLAAAINQNAGSVQLWNTTSWAAVRQLASSTQRVDTLAFSRDGLRLVTGGEDQSVRVWNVATGAQTSAFTSTQARVHRVDFSADSARVAFGDALGTLAVIPAP